MALANTTLMLFLLHAVPPRLCGPFYAQPQWKSTYVIIHLCGTSFAVFLLVMVGWRTGWLGGWMSGKQADVASFYVILIF